MGTVTIRALSIRIWGLRIDSAWRNCKAAFGRLFIERVNGFFREDGRAPEQYHAALGPRDRVGLAVA
jgi:hypothetical protein